MKKAFCLLIVLFFAFQPLTGTMSKTAPVNTNIISTKAVKSLTGYKICIDSGHGGSDAGAVGYDGSGYPNEEDFNLDMGLRLRDLLQAEEMNIYMTRTTDTDVSLQARCDIANNNNVDIFVSIHCNSVATETVQGTETYYWAENATLYSADGKKLANNLQTELIAHLGRPNRGIKGDKPSLGYHLYVLNNTNMPACLVEACFISNKTEFELMNTTTFKQEAAHAMYHGICAYFGVTPKTNISEMRALWAARWDITNATKIDNLIMICKSSNLNTIFFQVRGEGYALYNSTIDPKYPSVPTDFDPLAYVIEKAHQNSLEVHAWINFYNSGRSGVTYPSNHVLTQHPDWVAIDKYGNLSQGDAIYLCPGRIEVQKYLYNISLEICKNYSVDGIHYDHIRYQNSSFCYCSECKEKFKAEYGYYPIEGNANWSNWRRVQVTNLVKQIYLDAKTVRKNVKIGAAVWGIYSDGYTDYFQDSHDWCYKGMVDYIAPMTYYTDNNLFNTSLQNHITASYGKHIYAGIGVYKFVTNNDPLGMNNQIRYARVLGANGTVVFSYASLRDNPSFVGALNGTVAQDNSSIGTGVQLFVTSSHRAQRFIPQQPVLTRIDLPINSTVYTATATVTIREDNTSVTPSVPQSGTVLLSKKVPLTATSGVTWVTISCDNISVLPEKTYWICISWDGTNAISWYGSSSYDSDPAYSSDGGITWATSTWNGVYGYKTYTKFDGPFNTTASIPSISEATAIMEFSEGWNFVSFPLTLHYVKAGDMANAVPNCTHIAKWNVTSQSFLIFSKTDSQNSNFTLNITESYLLYLTAKTSFKINGTIILNQNKNMIVGWNIIGWFNTSISVTVLSKNVSDCKAVAYWDGLLGRFIVHPINTDISDFVVERGMSVFVYVSTPSTWAY